MDNLKCKTTANLHQSPIECPDCGRDYSIYEMIHTCHALVSCDAPARSYYEEYIAKVDAPRKKIISCESCERGKKSKPPTKGTCPGCKFNGYYTFGADRLCPSCVAIEKSAKVVKVVKPITEPTIISIVKTPAKVFFELSHTGISPVVDTCTSITIMVLTPESAASDNFFERTLSYTQHTPISEFIIELQKMLGELRARYILQWSGTDSLSWEWLKYLYQLHADKNGTTLA